MRKGLSTLGIIAIAGALCLAGCESQYGRQQTNVSYYPRCYEPVDHLRADENTVAKSTAAGAAGGALVGALIGFMATGKASGAVAGAAAGGAAGAVGGNIYGKKQAASRGAEMLARYSRQLDEDTASMNRATAAAKVAMQCYNAAFSQARDAYLDKKMTREELNARYQEIRDGLQEVSYILSRRYDSMAEKDEEYNRIFAEEMERARAEEEAARTKKTATRGGGKTASYVKARNSLEDTRVEVDSQVSSLDKDMQTLLANTQDA